MGNLHFSDTASDLIKMYVPERDNAMYAGYFLVSALRHAQEDVFPAECEVYHWVAKRFCEHVEGEELRSLKERIKSSGFLQEILDFKDPLVRVQPGTVNTYRLTRSGEELARKLLPLMECPGN